MAATALGTASVIIGLSSLLWNTWQDEEYEIATALNSNLVLTVYSGSTANAAPIQLWPNEHHDDQRWILKKRVGYCALVNKQTGKFMNCTGGPNIGSTVSQYQYEDDNSKWVLEPDGGCYTRIRHRGSDMCVDVPGAKAFNLQTLQQFKKQPGDVCQQYIFIKIK